ncbi:MAG: hypothetical protein U0694_00695 [Anaerolineae bacterium]
MVGGFHVVALVRHKKHKSAHRLLLSLARANKQAAHGKWGFNEWLHGGNSDGL